MFIQTETTPNEDSLKFIPGVEVMGEGTVEFTDTRSALKSPLAIRLMGIEGVTGVFYGPDFVTISKDSETSWSVIKPEVYAMLMEYFTRVFLGVLSGAIIYPGISPLRLTGVRVRTHSSAWPCNRRGRG